MAHGVPGTERKPVLLIVTAGYLPGTGHGGIATSRQNLAFAMQDYFDVRIVTLNHDYRDPEPYTGICEGWNERPEGSVLYLSDRDCTPDNFCSVMNELNPVAVYASGTITSYFTFNRSVFAAARLLGVPIVVTPDGDVCSEALAIKPLKKKLALLLCRLLKVFDDVTFQITLPEEGANLSKYLGVDSRKILLLPNLPFLFGGRSGYRKNRGSLKVVFCSRISPQKNPDFAISTISEAAASDLALHISLDVYGPMEDKVLWEKCRRLIDNAPDNFTVKYRGVLPPEDAKEVFKKYDLMILPTRSENYCYAVEESLLCGCPVLLSKGTTPWDDLDGVAGFVEPLYERTRYVERISAIARMSNDEYESLANGTRKYIEDKLDFCQLKASYRVMFHSMYKEIGR